jgi:ubiquinone/menaquinone biosynthesis C-methylase UbiE
VKLIGLLEKAYYVLHRRKNVVAALRERVTPGARVLDFGGGDGRVSEALRRDVPGRYVVADVDPGSLRLVPPGLRPVRIAPRPPLPFPDRCFQCVVVVDVLHHIGPAGDVLRDLVRCLDAEGRLLIVEMDERRPITRVFRRLVRLDGRRCHFWAPEPLAAALEDLGLRAHIRRLDALRFLVEAGRV